MKNPLSEFLFGEEAGHYHDTMHGLRVPTYFALDGTCGTDSKSHQVSAFVLGAAPPIPAQTGGMGLLNKGLNSRMTPAAGPPSASNPSGYNQFPDPEVKGIDPSAEISRINTNIAIYNGVIAASALGLGITMCLFVRSVLKPPKGVHGGDSDEDMESGSESDESDES